MYYGYGVGGLLVRILLSMLLTNRIKRLGSSRRGAEARRSPPRARPGSGSALGAPTRYRSARSRWMWLAQLVVQRGNGLRSPGTLAATREGVSKRRRVVGPTVAVLVVLLVIGASADSGGAPATDGLKPGEKLDSSTWQKAQNLLPPEVLRSE